MARPNLPDLWITSTLGSQLMRSDERIDPLTKPGEKFFYVGLEHIESNTGKLLDVPIVSGREIKSIKTLFHSGDILYGKLRPNLNKVYLAEQGGICSTDIWVFRTAPTVDAEYAAHYLRSAGLVQRMSQLAIGANLPRVDAAAFDSTPIPLPPLPEQRRIVSIIREADALRRLRGEANQRFQQFARAVFYKMFGEPDPRHNRHGWEIVTLGKFVEVGTGGTPDRDSPENYGGAHHWVKTTELRDQLITDTEETLSDKGLRSSNAKLYPVNTILLAMYGQGQTRGRTAKLGIPASTNQACAAFLPSEVLLPDYLWYWFQASYQTIRDLGRGGPQANLNLNILKNLRIPKPARELQEKFAEVLSTHSQAANLPKLSTDKINTLFDSILAQAFTGELTTRWRGQHEAELNEAARERDALLSESVVSDAARIPGATTLTAEATVTRLAPPEREQMVAALSRKQRRVLDLANSMEGYFTLPQLSQSRDEASELSHADIHQGLHLLAALGLVLHVRVATEPIKNELFFTPAYRRFSPSHDDSRLRDLDRLGADGG